MSKRLDDSDKPLDVPTRELPLPAAPLRVVKAPAAREHDENDPDVKAFVDLFCARLEPLAPHLVSRIREATRDDEEWTQAVYTISAVIAAAGEGSDILDLGLAETLSLFEATLGKETYRVLVEPTPLETVEEVSEVTRLALYRRQLFDACKGLITDETKRDLLLTTHPFGEGPKEILLYNITVIWVAEALFEQMDLSALEALPTKAAKKREKTRLEGLAREQEIALLAEKGVINPADQA